jgi:NADPH2:quinone reductase
MHEGERVAYPDGVRRELNAPPGVRLQSYNANYDPELMDRLNRLIDAGPFEVRIARTFSLDHVHEAHRALFSHLLRRLALRPRLSTKNPPPLTIVALTFSYQLQ